MTTTSVLKMSFSPRMDGLSQDTRWDERRRKWVRAGRPYPGQWYVFLRTQTGPTWEEETDHHLRRMTTERHDGEPLFTASTAEQCHQWCRENRHRYEVFSGTVDILT